jgi:hypothetical protein
MDLFKNNTAFQQMRAEETLSPQEVQKFELKPVFYDPSEEAHIDIVKMNDIKRLGRDY